MEFNQLTTYYSSGGQWRFIGEWRENIVKADKSNRQVSGIRSGKL